MTQAPTSPGGSTLTGEALEQLRSELAATGDRTQRANRPRMLVLLALAVLAGSLLYALSQWRSKGDAENKLVRARNFANDALDAAGRLQSLKARAAQNQAQSAGADVLTQLRSKVQDAAEAAGVKQARSLLPRSTRANRPQNSKSVQNLYDYEARDESLPALLSWVDRTTAEVSGLEVTNISISPEATQWFIKVTFARWERVEAPS